MKTMINEDESGSHHKTQGEYISHKEQRDHFFRMPQEKEDDFDDEHSEAESDGCAAHNNNNINNVQLTGSYNGGNAEVPRNL